MRNFISIIFVAFLLAGCAGKNDDTFLDSRLMRIESDCIPCSATKHNTIKMDQLEDKNMLTKCCGNPVDLSPGLKKVHISKVNDLDNDKKVVLVTSKFDKDQIYIDKYLSVIFEKMLEKELESMGILVVDDASSPYTLQIYFDFMDFKSYYFEENSRLNSSLYGNLTIKNINKKRVNRISASQDVRFLDIRSDEDIEIYINLLVKQIANKVALRIFKF